MEQPRGGAVPDGLVCLVESYSFTHDLPSIGLLPKLTAGNRLDVLTELKRTRQETRGGGRNYMLVWTDTLSTTPPYYRD